MNEENNWKHRKSTRDREINEGKEKNLKNGKNSKRKGKRIWLKKKIVIMCLLSFI